MKVALYTGDNTGAEFLVRLGTSATRLFQKGPYGDITHVEAIHDEYSDGTVTIVSASFRDKGVRSKRVKLNPLNWMIVDVPQWHLILSKAYLAQTIGMKYDWRGALATCLPGSPDRESSFCNKWVGHPFLRASETFGPHHFAAICVSLGTNVTKEFFESRQ